MQKFQSKFRAQIMHALTHEVSERFKFFILNSEKFQWNIHIGKEVIISAEVLPNFHIRLNYNKHVYSLDALTVTSEELPNIVSEKCFDLIQSYRRRNDIKIVDNKIVRPKKEVFAFPRRTQQ
jgi:hypothetical protein